MKINSNGIRYLRSVNDKTIATFSTYEFDLAKKKEIKRSCHVRFLLQFVAFLR